MTAHTYALARFPLDRRPTLYPARAASEAAASGCLLALIVATSREHAWRLWLEGTRAIRGVDGRLECFGIVNERGSE